MLVKSAGVLPSFSKLPTRFGVLPRYLIPILFISNLMSPTTIAPISNESVFICCPFWIYCAVTVKKTGEPINAGEA